MEVVVVTFLIVLQICVSTLMLCRDKTYECLHIMTFAGNISISINRLKCYVKFLSNLAYQTCFRLVILSLSSILYSSFIDPLFILNYSFILPSLIFHVPFACPLLFLSLPFINHLYILFQAFINLSFIHPLVFLLLILY